MKECCENCPHFIGCHELVNGEWRHFHICNIFEKDNYCIVVEPTDICEMFTEKEKE